MRYYAFCTGHQICLGAAAVSLALAGCQGFSERQACAVEHTCAGEDPHPPTLDHGDSDPDWVRSRPHRFGIQTPSVRTQTPSIPTQILSTQTYGAGTMVTAQATTASFPTSPPLLTESIWGAARPPSGLAGVTCSSFNAAAKLTWREKGSDWLDAEGVANGSAPFVTHAVGVISVPTQVTIELPVSLMLGDGITLKRPGSAEFRVASRNHENPDYWPRVLITLADGSEKVLYPEADFAVQVGGAGCTSPASAPEAARQ